MSGVEIAGFVLGAIPLMISAIEHYKESAEVLEGWWKIKKEWRRCKNDLNYHQVAFEENLEELLLPLIVDDEKLQRLLKFPGGPEWKDPALEDLLKERMPKMYLSYLATIQEMSGVVKALDDALGTNKIHFQSRVTEEYQIEKSSNSTKSISHVTVLSGQIEYQAQRIKLAFNKSTRQELFEEFGMYNARLRDILGSSDRLAALRRSRVSPKSAAINSGLWKFWTHANNIFDLLTEAWSCKCQALHHANLLLQHRVSSTVNFRVMFWYKSHLHLEGGQLQLPWTWQDTSINLWEGSQMPIVLQIPAIQNVSAKTDTLPATPPSTPSTMTSSTSTMSSIQSGISLNTKEVFRTNKDIHMSSHKAFFMKFKEQKGHKHHHHKNGSIHAATVPIPATSPPATPFNGTPTKAKVSFIDPTPPASTEEPSTSKITNLCTTIAACSPELPTYGCLVKDTRQYLIQPLCIADNQPQKLVTLENLLSKSSPIDLTRQQRYHIALILASSHVQLHPTPWLKSKWSKKYILFPHDSEDPTNISTEQPYISRSLSKSLQCQPRTSCTSSTYTFQDSIRNLGIMLLELCFGTAIEDHKLRRNLNAADEQSLQLINYAVATQWERAVVGEAGLDYADAVNWCLHNVPESGGSEDRWREDMFAGVVEKLRCCHDQLVGV